MQVAVGRLCHYGEPVHQVWLPPLPPVIPLDALLGPTAAHPGAAGRHRCGRGTATLTVPIGLIDLPLQQQQQPMVLDFTAQARQRRRRRRAAERQEHRCCAASCSACC